MNTRVVVTGMGAITPIGNSVEAFWTAVKSNTVGIAPITHFDTAGRLNRVVHIDISTDVKQPSGKSNTDTTAKFYTHGSA